MKANEAKKITALMSSGVVQAREVEEAADLAESIELLLKGITNEITKQAKNGHSEANIKHFEDIDGMVQTVVDRLREDGFIVTVESGIYDDIKVKWETDC